MPTVTLRSTKTLTDYVRITDRLATYSKLLKELERAEKQLRPAVLDEIGERREILVRGQIRVLEPGETSSIKRTCTDEEAVAFCRAHGLKYSERSAEYVAPATFTKYVKDGIVPAELYNVDREAIVIVKA